MLLARLQKKGTKIWLFAGVVLISAVAFFAWRVNFPAAQTPVYETQPAERGQLSASVTGTGTLRAGQSALIAWQISGRVENIQVGLNTVVSPGQELASLATDSLPKNTLLAQTDLVTAQKNLDQLLNTNLAQAQAQLDLANARQAVQDAQDQYETLLAPRGSQELLDDIKDQITQAQNQVKSLQKIYDRFFAHRPAGNPGKANMQLNLTRAKDNLTNLQGFHDRLCKFRQQRGLHHSGHLHEASIFVTLFEQLLYVPAQFRIVTAAVVDESASLPGIRKLHGLQIHAAQPWNGFGHDTPPMVPRLLLS